MCKDMQECAKKQRSLDFLTPNESRMRQRHVKIKARYDELKASYKVSDNRIFCKIAEEFDMTTNGVRQLIYRLNDTNRTESGE